LHRLRISDVDATLGEWESAGAEREWASSQPCASESVAPKIDVGNDSKTGWPELFSSPSS